MKINIRVLWFLPLLLIGCEVALENNQRATYTVTLLDDQQNPVKDIKVDVAVYSYDNSGNEFPADEFKGLIGSDRTDEHGSAAVLSLVPEFTSSRVIYVIANRGDRNFLRLSDERTFDNPDYGLVAYEVLLDEGKDITLPTIKLKRKAIFTLNLIRTSGTLEDLEYKITYERPSQVFELDGERSLVQDEFTGVTTSIDENLNTTTTIATLQRSTIFFTYLLSTQGTSVPTTIEIPINQNQVIYDFEY